jgi:hypothetical protein
MNSTDTDVIVIGEYEPPAAPAAPAQPTRIRLWPSRSIGVLATVLIHFLIAAPMVLGYAAHKTHPKTPDGIGSVAWASQGEESESMILLDLSALYAAEQEDLEKPDIKAEGILLEELKLQLVSLDPKPPSDLPIDEADLAETANVAAGDPTGSAALFGRYMGQVAARIERAWMRPRTAIEGGHFDCRAHIRQDRQGNVESIELLGCPNDEAWRRSLTSAILRASPLSAPPEPWLFTDTVTLSFTADQYVAGQTPEYQYEPLNTRLALAHVPVTLFREQQAGNDGNKEAQPSVLDGNGDISLTITGSEVHWERNPATTDKR